MFYKSRRSSYKITEFYLSQKRTKNVHEEQLEQLALPWLPCLATRVIRRIFPQLTLLRRQGVLSCIGQNRRGLTGAVNNQLTLGRGE